MRWGDGWSSVWWEREGEEERAKMSGTAVKSSPTATVQHSFTLSPPPPPAPPSPPQHTTLSVPRCWMAVRSTLLHVRLRLASAVLTMPPSPLRERPIVGDGGADLD